MKRTVYGTLLAFVVLSGYAYAQDQRTEAARPRLPPDGAGVRGGAPPAPGNGAKPTQGFVSKKTGKPLAEAAIEDITNENFPDMIESFDYPNADVADVIKAISELTGKNFIVDPQVRGKITIIAPSRITVAEAYKAFLSALAINGLAIVPGDGFYKIKQARAAQRDNIDTFSGAYYPTSDQMITRIIKLKYISADEVNKQLRILTSKDGELVPYTPTNSLIVSDYGANMDRIMKILEQLDVQGFEEQMEVIRVRFARAKDIADLVDQIINKGEKKNQFGGGVPRFRPAGTPDSGGGSGAEVYSLVVPDERTNSIIVVGNKAGIEKIRKLVARLDYPMRPDEQGGFFVYYLRHAEAEPIANVLNGIAAESKKAQDQATQTQNRPPPIGAQGQAQVGPAATAVFGGEVKISADKNTNSLIVVASRQDYETIKNLLAKIDVARDQVYIKAVIMEMNSNIANTWSVDAYKFDSDSNGIGRIGFRGSDIQSITNPTNDRGAILGFGAGGTVDITVGTEKFTVKSLMGLVRLVKTTNIGNILSTPQLMALDNEESEIEVGANMPVSLTSATSATGVVAPQVERQKVTTKLTITPYISPDTDTVQMKIKQEVADLLPVQITAAKLAENAIATSTRSVKTQVVVNSGDTAVLGGLMSDKDTEQISKVPILGDIPLIGWLFKSRTTEKAKLNLMIFISPTIVRNPSDNDKIVDAKINERIDFIQKNMIRMAERSTLYLAAIAARSPAPKNPPSRRFKFSF
ncbi:MAG TPA: type II secretion system secretin GspD [Bdellovibrionales bacterium]|nr:type II secretion system secretin GspD [Bdellovibrionales bacterium]